MDGEDPGNYPSHCKFSLRTWVTPGSFKPIDRDKDAGEDGEDGGGEGGEDGAAAAAAAAAQRHRKFGPGAGVGGVVASQRAEAEAEKKKKKKPFDPQKESQPGEGGGGEPKLSGVLRSEDCGFELHLEALAVYPHNAYS